MPVCRCLCAIGLLAAPLAPSTQDATPPTTAVFRNQTGSFQLQLPVGWRQVAPNEARRIGEHPTAPKVLTLAQPRSFYAVGPVEAWLAGDFGGAWLYVVEQSDEWHVGDDFAEVLRDSWARQGAATGEHHELQAIERTKVGTQDVDVVQAVRRTTPLPPRLPLQSLDVHAPTSGSQLSLSLQCPPERFAQWEPEFRRWLDSLTFARPSRAPAKLQDRLWTPLLTGAVVGLVLLGLYKHTRARR